MKAHDAFPSKFLKAPDLEIGNGQYRTMVLTIASVGSQTFDDGNVQRTLSFRENDKVLGLNKTNWNSVHELTAKDDDEDWPGAKIELYVDKNVMYGGKKMPAIRIRAVEGQPSQAQPATKVSAWSAWKKARGEVTDSWQADWIASVAALSERFKKSKEAFGPDEYAALADMATVMEPVEEMDDAKIPF